MDGVHGKDHKDPRALAATALNLMLQAAVEPTPDNFALWYTYSSGSVPALNREIDQLRHAATIDADSCRRLHTMFLEAENDASALEEAARHIEHSIANALSVITQAGEDSAGFARSITRLSQNIPAKPDASTLQRVTTELLNETRSMIQKARVLLDRLNGSKQEIVSLRSELDVVRREAETDALTGIGNRKMLDRALAHEIEQSTTHGGPLSLLMIDIDHFKKFNDNYGHDTGDEVLRLVASKLARVTGGGEAYRCGGEEFAILFCGKTTSEVADHLEQLRATIEGSSFRMRGDDRRQTPRGADRRNQRTRGRTSPGHAIRRLTQAPANHRSVLSVTVSIGVATSAKENADAEQVIRAADKALYRAKAAGRNRVETAAFPRRRTRVKAAGIA